MVEYTVGFMFSEDEREVILLQKKKKKGLEFLAGKWNGVGGTVEKDELPAVCMAREFEEEAGIKTAPEDWKLFAIIAGPEYNVNFYLTHYHDLYQYIQRESEKVSVFSVKQDTSPVVMEYDNYPPPSYHNINVVDNLKFLIPMALCAKDFATPVWIFYNN
jgi:8-oxo-dGTP pyrophosphatase MutT (NUDIX family)